MKRTVLFFLVIFSSASLFCGGSQSGEQKPFGGAPSSGWGFLKIDENKHVWTMGMKRGKQRLTKWDLQGSRLLFQGDHSIGSMMDGPRMHDLTVVDNKCYFFKEKALYYYSDQVNPQRLLDMKEEIAKYAISNSHIAIVDRYKHLTICDEEGTPLHEPKDLDCPSIQQVTFLNDTELAVCNNSKTIQLYSSKTGNKKAEITPKNLIKKILSKTTPKGYLVAVTEHPTVEGHEYVEFIDPENSESVITLPTDVVNAYDQNDEELLLASSNTQKVELKLYDIERGQQKGCYQIENIKGGRGAVKLDENEVAYTVFEKPTPAMRVYDFRQADK